MDIYTKPCLTQRRGFVFPATKEIENEKFYGRRILPEYSRQDLYFDKLLSGRLGGEKTFSGEGFKCPNVFMESSSFSKKAR